MPKADTLGFCRQLAVYFGGSLGLHLIWEKLHVPLYTGYQTFDWPFLVQIKAAGGDLVFMLTFYLALALIHRDLRWIIRPAAYRHPATWGITAWLGFLTATAFELWAVEIDHRWQYLETMPVIAGLGVGLSPVAQMVIIPLLTLMLCEYALTNGAAKKLPLR